MQTQEQTAEIKGRIAELRARYGKLRALCGSQAISRETIAEYTKELQALETQLN